VPAVDRQCAVDLAPLAGPDVLQHRSAIAHIEQQRAQLARHPGLLQPCVGGNEVTGAAELGGSHRIPGDDRRRTPRGGHLLGDPDPRPVADRVVHDDGAAGQPGQRRRGRSRGEHGGLELGASSTGQSLR
jgi:hypothetical protein